MPICVMEVWNATCSRICRCRHPVVLSGSWSGGSGRHARAPGPSRLRSVPGRRGPGLRFCPCSFLEWRVTDPVLDTWSSTVTRAMIVVIPRPAPAGDSVRRRPVAAGFRWGAWRRDGTADVHLPEPDSRARFSSCRFLRRRESYS